MFSPQLSLKEPVVRAQALSGKSLDVSTSTWRLKNGMDGVKFIIANKQRSRGASLFVKALHGEAMCVCVRVPEGLPLVPAKDCAALLSYHMNC